MSGSHQRGPLVLGIDGGGSKTLIALADREGTIVATSGGSGINPMDRPDWRAALDGMLAPYAARLSDIGAVVAGLPAYGELPPLSAEQEAAIAAFFGRKPQRVVNDVEAAHIGAFAGGPGVLILSGTGSMAWARDAAGHSLRVGGFGEAIGDEGSAHWIGIEAIARASRAMDGRIDAPDFLAAFLAHLGLDPASPQDGLIAWRASVEHARSEIAALARLVDTLAASGEPTALSIIDAAAEHLAAHVAAARRRIGDPALPWSTAGGTFASRLLRERTAARIGSEPVPPRLPPIGGALYGAARDLDWPVDEAWIGRLAASIENNAIHARNGRTPSPRRDDQ
ncbi:N-acetylglucosamine kinase [Kaistia geumhonensis]|uniref:N-acetylglucosamine kinase-like BadF-type ATPase n=1 Tax=Kaistia geumhonensis TaxID=410839 RepID=A0ABU0M7V3_9HYPH|nr:BadF/BadG/BcrA/BcrD ATPase family protein [Kaistia geumhonensis]MCX5477734.1 N-acetylglucosamine kinase [Kaistia geumhonensis]MDQ0517055.1 N-acetylglucosamine kinase-like BadF-type ATPase [Kaistia geumhonensis]